MEMDSKVLRYLYAPLQHSSGGNDDLHMRMEKVADKMHQAPKADAPHGSLDYEIMATLKAMSGDGSAKQAPIEELKRGIDTRPLRDQLEKNRKQIVDVQRVITTLNAAMSKGTMP